MTMQGLSIAEANTRGSQSVCSIMRLPLYVM